MNVTKVLGIVIMMIMAMGMGMVVVVGMARSLLSVGGSGSGLGIIICGTVIMTVNVGMPMKVMMVDRFQSPKAGNRHRCPERSDHQPGDQTEPGIELIRQDEA